MNKGKKRPYKWVTLAGAYRKKNDKQNPWRRMMIEVQRNMKAIKRTNKRKSCYNWPPCCSKFLEDGLTWNSVESIYNVYMEHHPIKMGIQSGPNTMEHNFITSSNHNLELIWWQMKNKHITKLQNYKHKTLFTSRYNVSPTAIKWNATKRLSQN